MSFNRLQPEDFVVSSDSITSTVWSGGQVVLSTFFTSSVQEAGSSGDFYLNVYQTSSTLPEAEIQFAIAYASKNGSGSAFYNNSVIGASPTKTIYSQYQNLILGDENASFIFGGVTSSDFWVISLDRTRYKEKLLPGSLTLTLTSGSESYTITDNSQVVASQTFTDAGRVYELVSGSAGVVNTSANSSGYMDFGAGGSYGWFLPDIGTLLIPTANFITGPLWNVSQSYNSNGYNNRVLFDIIKSGSNFQLNSQETISSNYVFVRARNSEFNYSENPSFISGSTGEVLFNQFINAPQTYPTTVGLYNDNNELLAVAKMSRPLLKDFTKEALIRIKLDF